MAFDFSFDPGTSAALQRGIDEITDSYRRQAREIDRTTGAVRKLDRELRELARTGRAAFEGRPRWHSGGPRGVVANIRDVVDLSRGRMNVGNVMGALELGTDVAQAAGFKRVAGVGSNILGAVPHAFAAGATVALASTLLVEVMDLIGGKALTSTANAAKDIKNLFADLPKDQQQEMTRLIWKNAARPAFTSGDIYTEMAQEGNVARKLASDQLELRKADPNLAAAALEGMRIDGDQRRGKPTPMGVVDTIEVNMALGRHAVNTAAAKLVETVRKAEEDDREYLRNNPAALARRQNAEQLFRRTEEYESTRKQSWNPD